ncbi:MAG TPA: Obg family GTPase CgtA, partial [Egibacteraceae bacterium]|nr:Obg family GTPase CgtA [Egibacteraceae bacterium]
VLRPADGKGQGFEVEAAEDGWRVRGERVERWVVMADLDNEEAVRYLQGRLVRAGVEKALLDAGARRGDAVEIAGAVFDFEPERADMPDDEDDDDDALEPLVDEVMFEDEDDDFALAEQQEDDAE